jgi:hypothetical protein
VSAKTATRAAEETTGNGIVEIEEIEENGETGEEIVAIAAVDLTDPTLKTDLRDGTSSRSAPAVVVLEVVTGTVETAVVIEESARDPQHPHGGRSLHQT